MSRTEQTQQNQSELNKKIQEALFTTIKSRRNEYESGKKTRPSSSSIDNIISSCSNKNATISGAVGLIPGPWGMAAAIPEIGLIIKNQMQMIYDIGMASGKEIKDISPELVLGIFVSSTGSTAVGVLTIHGSKILVKRSSLRVIQKVIAMLGGRVTQQVAKSAVAKWIPLAGAVAMAAWSRISTKKLGDKAKELFSKEIIYQEDLDFEESSNNIEDIPFSEVKTEENNDKDSDNNSFIYEKLKVLINLIKIDGNIDEREVELMSEIIDGSDIDDNIKIELIQSVATKEQLKINFDILKSEPTEAISLLLDLVRLSYIDEELHITEKMYIKQIGKILDIDKEEINELLSSSKETAMC